MRPYLIGIAVLASVGVPASAQEKLILKITPVKTIEAVQTFELINSQTVVDKWIVICAAAPEHPAQSKVKSSLEPGGKSSVDISPLKRPIVAASVPAKSKELQHKITVKVKHEAVLYSRILEPLDNDAKSPPSKPLPAEVSKLALATSAQLDFKDEAFQRWLDSKKLRRSTDEDEIAFAVRVLQVIRDGYTYHFQRSLDNPVSKVCGTNKIDCAGISNIFVAALRANNIPARVLIGRIAKSRDLKAKPTDVAYENYHCRAEFYSAGVGNWVPTEPTGTLASKDVAVRQFIGNDSGDMLILHIDPDVLLKIADKPEPLSALQSYYFRVAGKGPFDLKEGATDWQVKVTELK